jgi:hypothetical protein
MHEVLVKISPLGIHTLRLSCPVLRGHIAVLNSFASTIILDVSPWDAESDWPAVFKALNTQGDGTLSAIRVRSQLLGTPFKWRARGDELHYFRETARAWKLRGEGRRRQLRLVDEAGIELKLSVRK